MTEAPNISEDAVQLMKFHGSYMQDNREQRTFGAGKAYQVGAARVPSVRRRLCVGGAQPLASCCRQSLAFPSSRGTLAWRVRTEHRSVA